MENQTVQERVQLVTDYLLQDLVHEIPVQNALENEAAWRLGIERWLNEFDHETSLRRYPDHELVKLARTWAAEFFADCWQQSRHKMGDVILWRFKFSQSLLIVKGYYQAQPSTVELFHAGHFLALSHAAMTLEWEQTPVHSAQRPPTQRQAPIKQAPPSPLKSRRPFVACGIVFLVIVTLYLFG